MCDHAYRRHQEARTRGKVTWLLYRWLHRNPMRRKLKLDVQVSTETAWEYCMTYSTTYSATSGAFGATQPPGTPVVIFSTSRI